MYNPQELKYQVMREIYTYANCDFDDVSLLCEGKLLSGIDRYAYASGKMACLQPERYSNIHAKAYVRHQFVSATRRTGRTISGLQHD